MKFMKLGSKPDAFQADRNCVRCASSELETDIIIKVGDIKFHLHKFPLLSKSNTLQRLVPKAGEESGDEIELVGFPGGPKAFEICAKFCYGITVTLNAYNVATARCAAEYLEMTEDIDRGNLILKIEVFLNSSVLRNWKDTIIVLQSTTSLLPWSEQLKVVGKCIDSIASKTSVDPSLITWSYTCNRKVTTLNEIIQSGTKSPKKVESVPKDWWIEDVCELDIDLYKKVMVAIKSKGRMDGALIGEALKTYAIRWLPDTVDALLSDGNILRNKSLVETIICLLPPDKGVSCSCNFLLKLLKVAILIGADDSSKDDLIRSVGSKFEGACINDLLIPSRPPQTTIYDVELVLQLVEQFMVTQVSASEMKIVNNNSSESNFILGNGSLLKVGKLLDGYLSEVSRDPNLSVSSFIRLAQAIPKPARPIHDGLYRAIDVYLKEHKSLFKLEKRSLCGLMDVRKLTTEAAMHAAQNEQLPVRVVVQVLFFEQAKAAATLHVPHNADNIIDPPRESKAPWEKTIQDTRNSFRKQMDEMKIKEEELLKDGKHGKKVYKIRGTEAQLLPSRSKRIFDKFWSVGRGANLENRSSETSISSSQSPTSVVQGAATSCVLSTRNHRHSIS